jgi:DNA-binding NtrC family response regulator
MLRRRATILVVDDEVAILELETNFLAELGYNVIPTNSPDEALAIVAADRSVDLVLTDLVMLGDMDGWSLSERIHVLRPELKVAFTSGYVNPAAMAKLARSGLMVLHKPWRPDQLARFVQRALSV